MKLKWLDFSFLTIAFLVSNLWSPILKSKEVISEFDTAFEEDYFEDEADDEFSENDQHPDPLYYLNYSLYVFNDRVYFWVLKPVTQGYSKIIPKPGRQSVKFFFTNLRTPVRFVNCILQKKFVSAWTEIKSFAINSTMGVLGIFDPAQSRFGYTIAFEDLGQTLGHYQVGNGFYIVLPFIGPSTFRDTIGLVGDRFLTPSSYLPMIESIGVSSLRIVNRTSFRIGEYEQLKESSISPYVSMRDIYFQYREKLIRN